MTRLGELLKEEAVVDEWGRTPHTDFLSRWQQEKGWAMRRDELRARAAVIRDDELVTVTVRMWKEHAEAAATVRHKALEYIEANGFDSSSSAVAAIKWAQEEERKTRGAEAFITAIKDASTDELLKTVRELAQRQAANDEDVVNAEVPELPELPELPEQSESSKEDAEPSN